MNTTIGVVATTATLTKAECRKLAAVAHDGLARAIRPVHSMFDGDTIFCLSTGEHDLGVSNSAACADPTPVPAPSTRCSRPQPTASPLPAPGRSSRPVAAAARRATPTCALVPSRRLTDATLLT